MAYVYRHIRLDKNEPFYIGVGNDAFGYYKRANAKDGRNKLWRDVVNKTAYEVEIMVDYISFDEARMKEIEFIKLYGRKTHGGILCNLTDGGEGAVGLVLSQESRDKISKNRSGKYVAHNKGKKSELKGNRHPMWRKTHSDELKKKWSAERKGATPWNKNKKYTPSELEKTKHKGSHVTFVVDQFSIDGNYIRSYNSINDAAISGAHKGCISLCCQGKRKTAAGFVWKIKRGTTQGTSLHK